MEEEYEVPSPHEHALEEAFEKKSDGLAQKIALMTAVLATIGALISYQSGSAQNEAMFLKNQSILKQAEASDQWAFYQAKSMKGHLDEAVAVLSNAPEITARFLADQKKKKKRKLKFRPRHKNYRQNPANWEKSPKQSLNPMSAWLSH